MLWNCAEIDELEASILSKSIGLSSVVTRILVDRGLNEVENGIFITNKINNEKK